MQLNDGPVCPGNSRTVFQCSGIFISWMVILRDRSQTYPLALTRLDLLAIESLVHSTLL